MPATFADQVRRPARRADAPRGDVRVSSRSVRERPVGRRDAGGRPAPPGRTRPAGTRCAAPAHDPRGMTSWETIARRRAVTAAVLVGAALAVLVWVLIVVGNNYAAVVAPDPDGSSLVYVRSGESLSAVAARVAPEHPVEVVAEQIRELNDLAGSGLTVGQPLLVPRYR
ncbi:LysM peptidoglycan-binding domain-containing protein [Gordonia pseudamarae]|uniref:LysM peptidoglycan-binding domain-containing protein n=2 Tax=Gordoniaceae TaxID=85026 RepID=A0ABX6IH04_9ACTN|nr:LysM peptidoglycan-binding domain-containing protein [Gordonia sp. (in: high G+C Gram-positive bacteria)]QHN26230.1 LysM peptidoglycan-binding domain-containing protein [Gordonia pseudamarae]QHN35123.1 LysM peptidoglycan-binding domain-containing protein [Gordonia pseudamarae]